LKKITAGIIAIVLVCVMSISSFGFYSLYQPSDNTPSDNGPPSKFTYVDVTNVTVSVDLPVNRVVPIMGIELVVAIGAQDKIVGRSDIDDEGTALLGQSIMGIPIVGSVELILEMEPDLVLVGELYSVADVEILREAGIPVIVDRTVRPRRSSLISALGVMLGAESKAEELTSFEAYYENLVHERLKSIPESEKPVVYFEFYMPGYSCGPGNSFHDLLIEAGATNMAEEQIPIPIVSTEYVIERNPDIVVRMLTYLDGLDLDSFIALKDEFTSRAGMGQVNAVKNDKVYIVKNTVIVTRETIGLLYYAKWFHPDLFTDIDPAAIHAEMIATFFGAELEGVFSYP